MKDRKVQDNYGAKGAHGCAYNISGIDQVRGRLARFSGGEIGLLMFLPIPAYI